MTSIPFTAALRHSVAVIALMLMTSAPAIAQVAADGSLIKRGEYFAKAGDCVACHTAPGGRAMAGGLALPTPIGDIISTNITPSKTNGIGNYTFEQFSNALRLGIRGDGQRLYPAMPYTSYALLTDDDTRALYAYFRQSIEPVDSATPPTELPFPFNIRLSMAAWNILFLDTKRFQPEAQQSAEWNRGAYLVRGLAHCGDCHTPRNLLMAEKSSEFLGGGDVGVWHAPNITSDDNSGIGSWSIEELTAYMKDGHAAGKAQAAGPMAEAVDNSLRYLDDADLNAIVVYLKSTVAIHDAADTRPASSWTGAADDLSKIRGVALPADPAAMSGPQLYDGYCASCHQARGEGSFDGSLPPLIHDTSLGRSNTNNLVMVILEGVQRQPDVFMPAFDKTLSDAQIATLGNFVLQRFGNPQAKITTDQVETLRDGGAKSFLLTAARIAIGAAGLVLVLAILFLFRQRRFKASKLRFG